jgi:hypothetical protein
VRLRVQCGLAWVAIMTTQTTFFKLVSTLTQILVAIRITLRGMNGIQVITMQIKNFSVLPGQTIAVLVGPLSDGSGRGAVTMVNYTTGYALPTIVVPIPTTDPPITGVSSKCAEWIVERPTVGNQLTELVNFGEVNFTSAGAVTGTAPKGETIAGDSQATIYTMLGDDGVTPVATETTVEALNVWFSADSTLRIP